MLAGLLSDTLKPPEQESKDARWQFWLIWVIGVFFIAA
jgi:hypothetical protein